MTTTTKPRPIEDAELLTIYDMHTSDKLSFGVIGKTLNRHPATVWKAYQKYLKNRQEIDEQYLPQKKSIWQKLKSFFGF